MQIIRYCFIWCLIFLVSGVVMAVDPAAKHPKTGKPLVIDCFRGTPTIDGNLKDWNPNPNTSSGSSTQSAMGPESSGELSSLSFEEEVSSCSKGPPVPNVSSTENESERMQPVRRSYGDKQHLLFYGDKDERVAWIPDDSVFLDDSGRNLNDDANRMLTAQWV